MNDLTYLIIAAAAVTATLFLIVLIESLRLLASDEH